MKPLHLAIAAAAVAVGALLWWMVDPGEMHGSVARRGGPDEPRGAATEVVEAEPPAGFALSVAVVLPDSAPAEGAAVELQGPVARTAEADTSGRVRFQGLPGGRYDLLGRSGHFAGALDLVLGADMETTLRLARALVVRGHLYRAAGAPIVGGTVEAAVPSTTHWILANARRYLPDPIAGRAVSGAGGSYELLLPGSGHYSLRASAAGFVAKSEPPRRVETDLEGIDFYLDPGSVIEGRVLDPDDRPVPAALVVVSGGVAKSTATTGADGVFRVTPAEGYSMTLSVHAAGFAEHVEQGLVTPVRYLTIRLQRGLTLRARAMDDTTGAGLEGLRALLSYGGATREGVTGPNGELLFERLPSRRGLRELFLTGGGYVPRVLDLSRFEAVNGVIDAGDVGLQLGGIARGRVLDAESGRPIPGAEVFWWARARINVAGLAGARTDDRGAYELTGVPLDAALLVAIHPDYLAEEDLRRLFETTDRLFPEGQTFVEKDVLLKPAAVVEGVVLTPAGEPVEGALVRAVNRRWGVPGLASTQPSTVTGPDGSFRLRASARDEQATLQATHRAFGASAPVRAIAGSGERVTLRLVPAPEVHGQVTDARGKPVAGVRVSVSPRERLATPTNQVSGASDAEGRFVVRNAAAGEVVIDFQHPDYRPVRREVAIPDGTERHDLGRIALEAGPTIAGVVRSPDGTPVEGVRVTASYQRDPGEDVRSFRDPSKGRTWWTATTDAEGRFALRGLREGRHLLMFAREGWFGARPVVTTGTNDLEIVLKPAAVLRGRVTGDHGPVRGAWVSAAVPVGESSSHLGGTRTSERGEFLLPGLPPDQPVTLTVRHDDYELLEIRNYRVAGGRREFVLSRGVGFAGVVVEDNGTPVANTSLRIYADGKRVKWTRTDEQGHFRVSGLPAAGSLEVEAAWSPIGHVPSGRIAVQAGDEDVRVVLRRGLTISGVILDRAGEPATCQVEAVDGSGRTVAQAWSWSEGRFLLQGLPDGRYTLRVSRFLESERRVLLELADVATGNQELMIRLP